MIFQILFYIFYFLKTHFVYLKGRVVEKDIYPVFTPQMAPVAGAVPDHQQHGEGLDRDWHEVAA